MPPLVPLAKVAVIVEPWDPMCREKEFVINPEDLATSVPAVEMSFSRIWHGGVSWKPFGIGSNI
jgi:hypothetical protein